MGGKSKSRQPDKIAGVAALAAMIVRDPDAVPTVQFKQIASHFAATPNGFQIMEAA
jgi:hypothetical protein